MTTPDRATAKTSERPGPHDNVCLMAHIKPQRTSEGGGKGWDEEEMGEERNWIGLRKMLGMVAVIPTES